MDILTSILENEEKTQFLELIKKQIKEHNELKSVVIKLLEEKIKLQDELIKEQRELINNQNKTINRLTNESKFSSF